MKILIVSDAWKPQLNGVVRTYEYLVTELEKSGHEVKVIGPADFPLRMPTPGYSEIELALFPYGRLKKLAARFNPDHVHIATEEVLSPASPTPHVLIAFNQPSLDKFGPTVQANGTIIYDSSVTSQIPDGIDPSVALIGVPCTEIAQNLGKRMVKNVVSLGALRAATNLFPRETFLLTLKQALKDKCAMLPLNEAAFTEGEKACEEAMAAGTPATAAP